MCKIIIFLRYAREIHEECYFFKKYFFFMMSLLIFRIFVFILYNIHNYAFLSVDKRIFSRYHIKHLIFKLLSAKGNPTYEYRDL